MSDTHSTIEDDPVLRKVGRYEILREVGRGGTAVVYLARQTDLERRVALKELAAFHAADATFAERFIREARLAGSLNHPNIVTVHEYFEHEGAPFMAMEYFERGSLRTLVGNLTLPQTAGVLEGVLAGLKLAEKRGIVHRDLKPENVMVTSDGGVKITDFGIAKALQATPGSGSLTSSGSTVGTPAYMAPELALGKEIGPWTDLYALGVMAYELLAGSVPFDRSEMPIAILLRHVNEPVAPLWSVRPELDPRLSGWVEQLLAKDPARRPATVATAADELEEILIGVLGPRWRRGAALGAAATVPVAPGDDNGIASTQGGLVRATPVQVTSPRLGARRSRRVRVLVASGAVLVAALGAAGAAVLLTRGNENHATSHGKPTGKPALVRDVIPTAVQRVSISVSGSSVFLADPRGRVIALDRSSLAPRTVSTDPVGPQSLALYRGRLLVADGKTLLQLAPDTLAPRGAQRLVGSTTFASAPGAPPVAIVARGGGGLLCTLSATGSVAECTSLAYAPTGVGVAGGRVAVADGRRGTVALFARRGASLVRTRQPIAVGPAPHGVASFFRGRLYVSIERGIAVLDLARRSVHRIALPVTPAALWVVPFNGRLVAALPGRGQVAVLDTARLASPRFVTVGGEPVGVAGGLTGTGPREVVVVDAESGRVARLDAQTGALLGSVRVAQLTSPTPPSLVLREATSATSGDRQTITLTLAGRGVDARALTTPDLDVGDGRAMVELWQGGARSAFASRTFGAVTIGVSARPARLELDVSAAARAFTSLAVLRRDRHTVVLELVAAPHAVRPNGGQSSNGGTGPTKPHTKPTKPGGTTTTTTPLVQD